MFTNKPKGGDASSASSSPAQEAIRPAASKPTARTAPSIISNDMVITGSVTSDGEMQIDGRIDGDVTAVSLTIGQSGSITGEVKAETVIVRGGVKGAIRARKVELESGAKVEGDIVHTSLAIQANAIFEGQVKRVDDPLRKSSGAATQSSAAKPAAVSSGGPAPSAGGLGGAPRPNS